MEILTVKLREMAEKSRLMIDCCKDKIAVPMKVDMEVTKCWTGETIN